MFLTLRTNWILLMLAVALMSAAVLFARTWSGFGAAIMLLSVLKFLLVAFYFMEMSKAHPAWRAILTIFAVIVAAAVVMMK